MKGVYQFLTALLVFCILTWGIVTTLIFFGVPAHVNVLVPSEKLSELSATCPTGSAICLGINTITPMISFVFDRMGSLMWYFIVVGVLYAAFIGWQAFVHGDLRMQIKVKPWYIYAAFLAAVWLIFTTLANGSLFNQKDLELRYIIEPNAEIYSNLNEEGLQAMRTHFEDLQERNCLFDTRQVINTTPVYKMRQMCVQGYFFSRVFTQFLFISFLILLFLVTGGAALSRSALQKESFLIRTITSLFLGAAIWIVLLWLLAVAHLFTAPVLWGLVGVVLAVCYKQVVYWCKQLWSYEWEVEFTWHSSIVFTSFILLSLLAFNFLSVVRPFPIGWDDLGVYLNQPRLLTSYGHITTFMASFRWEYLTSLGFALFGYNSTFGPTASMMINWLAGLFAVSSILIFGARLVTMRIAILAAVLYYYLPVVGHFSFADMKTDNAVFAFQSISLFFILKSVLSAKAMDASTKRMYLLLAGVFTGVAFATKATATMMLFANLAVIAAAYTGVFGFLGMCSVAFTVYAVQGIFSLTKILERTNLPFSENQLFIVLLIASIGLCGVAAVRYKQQMRTMLTTMIWYVVVFLVAILPWLTYNNIQHGTFPPRLHTMLPNTAPSLQYSDLPESLAIDTTAEQCVASGGKEELDRYWGFGTGVAHYALLPWRALMNIDIVGYYVTMYPYIALFPLFLLVPFIWSSQRRKFYLTLFGVTVFLILQWIFLANGVIWYGIGMFAGISLSLAVLTYTSPKVAQIPLVGLLALSLISSFSMRLWQFTMQQNMVEYAMGKTSNRIMEERTIPHYDNIAETIIELHKNEERPYVYRVGTFIPYFVPKNTEVFGIEDHQLDFFNCISQERDDALTLQRLQALGFNSIIFDTNTATIEKDPNGSLHKKVENFAQFINNTSLGLRIVVNDPAAGVAYILLP